MPSNKRETTIGFGEGKNPSVHQTFIPDLKSVIAFLSNAEKYYIYVYIHMHTYIHTCLSIHLYLCVYV